jgi:hypothetical protein
VTMPTVGIRGINPIWLEADLTGHLFDDTFYLYVLQNTIPYNFADVFHDINLAQPWDQPIQFLANGTLPLDIFWNPDPTLVYRLEFRQNDGTMPPSQADALIYEVDDYTPASGNSSSINTVATTTDNEFTNPQFALVNFEVPLTITAGGTYEIAPGWFLDLGGAGTATITQVPLNNTSSNPSNAPYALRLQLSGWNSNSVVLRQRFEQNGMLWAGKYVSSAVTAATGSSGPAFQPLTAILVDSQGTPLGTVLSVPIVNATLTQYSFVTPVKLPPTTNSDVPPDAYIEYQLQLASTNDIYLTSFQILAEDLPVSVNFTQDTINRQIDHTFNYFKDPIFFKPIPSLLTAWDFPLNPAQFGSTGSLTGSLAYLWDQTLGVQGSTASVSYARNAISSGLEFTTGNANTEVWYISQYITGAQAKKILGTTLSINLNAYKTAVGGAIGFKIYLLRGSSAAVVPTLPLKLGTVGSNGDFALNSTAGQGQNWSYVPRAGIGDTTGVAQGTLNVVTTNDEINDSANDYGFNGWEIINATQIGDTDKFCVLVTFTYNTNATVAIINSISLVPGDIPTRPAPQTFNQVLEECQYYYETNYIAGVPEGTISSTTLIEEQGADYSGGSVRGYATSFGSLFNTYKRAGPNVVLYSPDSGTANTVTFNVYSGGTSQNSLAISSTTNWTILADNRGISAIAKNANDLVTAATATSTRPFGNIFYHFSADARLGIV